MTDELDEMHVCGVHRFVPTAAFGVCQSCGGGYSDPIHDAPEQRPPLDTRANIGGYWSVEDGRPYWVDGETHAHLSPVSLEPRHPAWSALAEIIWRSRAQLDGSADDPMTEVADWLVEVGYPYNFRTDPLPPLQLRTAVEEAWVRRDGPDDADVIRETCAEEGGWLVGSADDR